MGTSSSAYEDKAHLKTGLLKYVNWQQQDFECLWVRFKELGLGFALSHDDLSVLMNEEDVRQIRDLFAVFDQETLDLIDVFEFVSSLALCSRMTLREKTCFIQNMYDFNDSSFFSFDEVTIIARSALLGIAKADSNRRQETILPSSFQNFAHRCFQQFSLDPDTDISGDLIFEFCNKDAETLRFIEYCSGLLTPAIILESDGWIDVEWAASPQCLYLEPARPPIGVLLPEAVWWRSLSKICPIAPVLFADSVNPTLAIPGKLSNEWFIDAANMLLAKPRLLYRLFVPTTQEDIGRYCVKFWKDGKWVRVVVDGSFPCDCTGAPIYAHGLEPNQVWPNVIEKAYAKLHGSYEVLAEDSLDYALTDLTGGRVERILLRRVLTHTERNDLWEKINSMLVEGILGATHSSSASSGEEIADAVRAGVVIGHTYSIVEAFENTGGQRAVRLRSRPLGRKFTEGLTIIENKDTHPVKNRLSHFKSYDSDFLVSYEIFLKFFNLLRYTCIWGDEWYSQRRHGSWSHGNAGGCIQNESWVKNPQYAVEVYDEQGCELCFELFQPDGRYHLPASISETNIQLSSRFMNKKTSTYDAAIGILLVKHDWGGPGVGDGLVHPLQWLAEDIVIGLTIPFHCARSIVLTRSHLAKGKYIVIPMTFESRTYSEYTIIARSKKKILLADFADLDWENIDDSSVVGGDADSDSDQRREQNKTPDIDSILKKLWERRSDETQLNKLSFITQVETENEFHMKPKYKAIQDMHRLIWSVYEEVELLRRKTSSFNNRIAGLEQGYKKR